MTIPPLTYRTSPAPGVPLTAADHDSNLTTIRDFVNALAALQGVALNADGTLKDGAVTTTAKIADRIITSAKLDWSFNFYAVAAGTGTYTATINPTTGFTYGDGAATSFICFVKFTNANLSTPCTLAVNGGAAKTIKKNVTADLAVGDITSGAIHCLAYDGTNFQVLSSFPQTAMVSGIVSNSGVGNAAALGAGATLIGTMSLTLPAGATAWTWVRFVFSGQLISDSGLQSFSTPVVKVGITTLTLVTNWGGEIVCDNSDDTVQFTYIAEGPPTGFLTTTPLALDLYAQWGSSGIGDTIAKRKMYAIGWYK